MSEWKPGDVAVLVDRDGDASVGICHIAGGGTEANYAHRARWLTSTGDEVWSSVAAIRPLVVIDPEDRETCEDLADALTKVGIRNSGWDLVRAGLREFAHPTSPKSTWTDGDVVQQKTADDA